MSQVELDPRNQEAIEAALKGIWDKAAILNAELFEDYPDDVDILNRLAKAYTELGQVNKARSTYEKVLENDPYNPIAMRNLELLSTLRGVKTKEISTKQINPEIFLEEPGKTKTVEVIDLAMPKVLANLRVGDPVLLNVNKNEVSVISEDNHRLGKLETVWGSKIAQAINLGSSFSAVVKSIKISKKPKETLLAIFVREVKHSKKMVNPLFPIENSNFTPYVRENTLSYLKNNEQPVLSETSDDIQEVEVEEIPQDNFEESPSTNSKLIEDEEDLSPT